MLELDDLRRQWQQPEATPPPVNAAELGQLLTPKADDLVEKMRRNTWYETGFTWCIVAAVPVYAWLHRGLVMQQLLAASMLAMSVVLLVHYYRQLRLLRRMDQPETQVLTHLGVLCAGLRQQLRFYYRLTIFTLPYMLLLLLGVQAGRELAHPGPFPWKFIGLLAASYAVLGAITQVGLVYVTRWYLQRLYGQHLDRLEASLRELDEPVPAGAR